MISSIPDASGALDFILSEPPDLVIVEKGLDAGMARLIIQSLKFNLNMGHLPILLYVPQREEANPPDWKDYPVDDFFGPSTGIGEIILRVTLALDRAERTRDANPLTHLPGNTSILKRIQQILDQGLEASVAYADLDNFKPYNDLYGFARGDEVLRMLARILVNVVGENVGREGFVGHVGGDDFVFIVPPESAETVCRLVLSGFESLIPAFFNPETLEAGCFVGTDRKGSSETFPLTALSIAVVPCRAGRFKHYGEVAAAAAQVKKAVKAIQGNAYLIDRRGA